MTVLSTETGYELLAGSFRPVFDRIAGGFFTARRIPGHRGYGRPL